MRKTIVSVIATTEAAESTAVGAVPVIALPESFPVETVTLGRKPNNDGDNSGAMWFE